MVLIVIRLRLVTRKRGRGVRLTIRVRKRLRDGRGVCSKRIRRERITALGVVRLDGVSGLQRRRVMAAAAHRSDLRASTKLGIPCGVRGVSGNVGATGAIVEIVVRGGSCETGGFESVLVPAQASERTVAALEFVWLGAGSSKGVIRGTFAWLACKTSSTDTCDARRTSLAIFPAPRPTDSGRREGSRTSGIRVILRHLGHAVSVVARRERRELVCSVAIVRITIAAATAAVTPRPVTARVGIRVFVKGRAGRGCSLCGRFGNVPVEFLGPTSPDRVGHERDDECDDDQANDGEDARHRARVGKEPRAQVK